MKFLTIFIAIVLIYQASAGSPSYSSIPSLPPTQPLCVDCQEFWRNGADLSDSQCDPAGKFVCYAEAVVAVGNLGVAGHCAGIPTDPFNDVDRSSLLSYAEVFCAD